MDIKNGLYHIFNGVDHGYYKPTGPIRYGAPFTIEQSGNILSGLRIYGNMMAAQPAIMTNENGKPILDDDGKEIGTIVGAFQEDDRFPSTNGAGYGKEADLLPMQGQDIFSDRALALAEPKSQSNNFFNTDRWQDYPLPPQEIPDSAYKFNKFDHYLKTHFLTAYVVGKKAGISISIPQKLATGEKTISRLQMDTAKKLADTLGLTLEELYKLDGDYRVVRTNREDAEWRTDHSLPVWWGEKNSGREPMPVTELETQDPYDKYCFFNKTEGIEFFKEED